MGRMIHGSPIRCFEASHVGRIELFWVLLPEPVVSDQKFHWVWKGWYVFLLSVQAQARRLRHVHLRSEITLSTEKQLNRQKTSSAVTTNHSFVPKRSRRRDN
jgi:hypothetical protein